MSALGRTAAAVVVIMAMLGATALPAGAHGGSGEIELLDARTSAAGRVSVEVCVTFALDREQADTARVTMRARGPADAEVEPVNMATGDQPGIRTGSLDLDSSGSWTVIVESAFPPAQLVVPVTVGDDGAEPVAPAVGTGAKCEPSADGGASWPVASLAVVAAVAAFGAVLLRLRRRGEPSDAAETT